MPSSAEGIHLLGQVLSEVRRLGNRMDIRDDLSDLVRKAVTGIGRLEEQNRGMSKRWDALEARVAALERKVHGA